jgi:hypothetical protein
MGETEKEMALGLYLGGQVEGAGQGKGLIVEE